MPLSPDTQRELHHRLRLIEDEARRLIDNVCSLLGGDQRERRRFTAAKMELLVEAIEGLIYDDPEDPDHEIEALNRKGDELIAMRAEISREVRRVRRAEDRLALDRRDLELRLKGDELAVIEQRIGDGR